jgi:Zn finger protein HypA/HybF involved in hydrogenase expression
MDFHKHTVKTNCKFCGKVFDSFNLSKTCKHCEENMGAYFEKIKEYLADNPGATTSDTCVDLGLSAAIVSFFIKEERLIAKSLNGKLVLKCQSCGKPIETGQLCFNCKAKAALQGKKTEAAPIMKAASKHKFFTQG